MIYFLPTVAPCLKNLDNFFKVVSSTFNLVAIFHTERVAAYYQVNLVHVSPQTVRPTENKGASYAFDFQSRCFMSLEEMSFQTVEAGVLLATGGAGETTHLCQVRQKFVPS